MPKTSLGRPCLESCFLSASSNHSQTGSQLDNDVFFNKASQSQPITTFLTIFSPLT
ncbi:hypothetical protein M378DRAFT_164172 [Amanita muscaria Koide BX008]|uniref:Uncharacterized protein n=1 Tax=Amanita muscaria (strain Koide BX008) TaxID=946122 RepID=A0A0C2TAI7_AMAMK|nr:hypothetical protein M378DRAFT_164172 [Amanita muscaria Koide BX008]